MTTMHAARMTRRTVPGTVGFWGLSASEEGWPDSWRGPGHCIRVSFSRDGSSLHKLADELGPAVPVVSAAAGANLGHAHGGIAGPSPVVIKRFKLPLR